MHISTNFLTAIVKRNVFLFFYLFVFSGITAQTPTFYTGNVNSPSNSFPFNQTTGKIMQSLIAPGEFIGGTSGAYFGYITKFYVQGTASVAGVWSNLTIRMALSTTPTLPTGAMYTATPFTTVYTASTASITSSAAGWLLITLQSPFLYDPTKSLVVEISQCASTGGGFSVTNVTKTGFRRAYNSSSCTPGYGGQDALLFNCGVDMQRASYDDAGVISIDSPYTYCTPGFNNVYATVKNLGRNQITNVNVNWSVNGIPQMSTGYFSLLDTFGGLGSSTAQINLGSYYFPASPLTIKAWTSYPNSVTDTVPDNDSATVTKQTSMSGIYTIDPAGSGPTNYTSFTTALAALQSSGVCGPTTFLVAAGTYTGQLNIAGPFIGSSSANPIIFDGVNAATRILTYAAASTSFPTVILNNASYVTLRNLTINATTANYAFGVLINNYSTGCRISNCVITVPTTASTSVIPIVLGGSVTSYSAGGRVDAVEIDSNIIYNGYMGISMYCSSANPSMLNKVRNNQILSSYYYGIYSYYQLGVSILNNRIVPSTAYSTNYGIALQNSNSIGINPVIISGNKITNFGYYGLYLTSCINSSTKGLITSNMIGGGIKTTSGLAVYMNNASNWSIANNSFHNDFASTLTSPPYAPLLLQTGCNNISINNNIFAVKQTGNPALALSALSPAMIDSMDYNVFYRADTNDHLLLYMGANFSTTNFKGAGGFNVHSVFLNPGFVNDTNLRINIPCLRGMTLQYITKDADGNTRTSPPNIGAFEVIRTPNDISPLAILSPTFPISAGSQNLRVRIINYGSNNVFSFNVSYKLNGNTPVTQTWSGILSPCDTVSVLFSGAQQLNIGNGVNNLSVYTGNPNFVLDGIISNDTLNTVFLTAMGGTYVIGTPPSNYTTFGAAMTDLQTLGMGNPINFVVKSGTYNESINFTTPTGASLTNTVTFNSQANNRDSVIINSNGTYVLNIAGSYCNIRNLTFNQQSFTTSGAVSFTGNSSNITIYNCKLLVPTNVSLTSNVIFGNGMTLNNIVLRKNLIQGSYYGLNLISSNTNYSDNCIIDSNIIQNIGYSNQLQYFTNLKFRNNTVNINTNNHIFLVQYANAGYEFTGNQISLSAGLTTTMFLGYYCAGTSGNRIKINNNTFTAPASATINLFAPYYYSSYVDFYNNSLALGSGFLEIGYNSDNIRCYNNSISSVNANYSLFHNESGTTNIECKNNVISNTGGGVALYWVGLPTAATYDYNNLYTTGSNLVSANSGGTNYSSLIAWRAAYGFDRNSLSYLPGFTNVISNLSPNNADASSWSLNGRGMPQSWISSDINGNARSAQISTGATDIGAYEFTPTALPPSATATPATPVANAIQHFIFGGDSVASIYWGASAPSSVQLKLYSGTNPTPIGSSIKYTNAYWDLAAPAGSYTYDMKLYYKPNWQGIVPFESNMVIAQKLSGSNWGIASSVYSIDSINHFMIGNGLSQITNFTGVDLASLNLTNNTISGAQTICSGNTPTALSGSVPIGGSGFYTYSWLSSTTGASSGFAITGGTNNTQNYSPASLIATTWFRRFVTSGVFSDTSEAIQIIANPVITSNTLSGSQSVCSGSTPTLISAPTPSGGNGTYTYLWLSSVTGATSGFVVAGGTNNTPAYSSPALTATTWYRRLVISGGCTDTSNTYVINVTPTIVGNTIGSSQSILINTTPVPLTGALPSGGSGIYSYLWLSSTTGGTSGFTPASGTNNTQNYSPSILSQTTWYRRIVISGSCSDTSLSIGISVNSSIANNVISSSQSICSGNTPTALTGTTPSGGTGTFTYTWLSSTSSATSGFAAASGTNNTSGYAPGTLAVTTWYRRVVVSGPATDTSLAVSITVPPPIANNTVSSSQTICSGNTPSSLTGGLPTGGTGTYTYLWLSSTTSATSGFTTASGTNNTQFYSPSILTNTTWYARKVVSGVCNTDTSAAVQITVNTIPAIVAQPATDTVCGTTGTFTVNATGGNLNYQWQSKSNGVWTNTGTNSSTLNATGTPNFLAGITSPDQFKFASRCTISNSCGTVNSDTPYMMVMTSVWRGTINNNSTNATNWKCNQVPGLGTANIIIPSSAANNLSFSGKQSLYFLIIGPAKSFAMSSNSDSLYINREILYLPGGNLDATKGTFLFTDGNLPQFIPATTYYNLAIQCNSFAILNGNTIIKNRITSTVPIRTSDELLIDTNATFVLNTVITEGFSSFNAKLTIRNIGAGGRTGSVLFPVGRTLGTYHPVTISNFGTADAFSVTVFDNVYNSYSSGRIPVGANITNNAVNKTWIIAEGTPGGSNATVTLQWNAADELSGFNRSSSYISRYAPTGWVPALATAASGANPFTQTLPGITTFSPFGVGSSGTLPVELISFTGTRKGNYVELNWATANEINNDYFEIERSLVNGHWSVVGKVKGNGNTSSISNYQLTDILNTLTMGNINTLYYRLKQVDFDGKINEEKIIAVEIENNIAAMTIKAEPNPFTSLLSVAVTNNEDDHIKLQITDMTGRIISEQHTNVVSGENRIEMKGTDELKAGMYFVKVTGKTGTVIQKVIRQN